MGSRVNRSGFSVSRGSIYSVFYFLRPYKWLIRPLELRSFLGFPLLL